MSQCEECGREFFAVRIGQKYCNADCRMERWKRDNPKNEKLKTVKTCRCCEKVFETSDSRKVYCSDECKIKHRNSLRPTTKEVERKCPVCGTMFAPMQSRGVGKMCCSDVCTVEHRRGVKAAEKLKARKKEQSRLEQLRLSRQQRAARPLEAKHKDLMKDFGITLDDYNRMLEEQGGVCAICKQPETIFDRRIGRLRNLAVDHDHTTGQVRKLLCTRCNQGIGNLQESADRLQSAIDYLRQFE